MMRFHSRRIAARTLAQDLGVVDLADVEMVASAGGPRLADAPVGHQIVRRTAKQQSAAHASPAHRRRVRSAATR